VRLKFYRYVNKSDSARSARWVKIAKVNPEQNLILPVLAFSIGCYMLII